MRYFGRNFWPKFLTPTKKKKVKIFVKTFSKLFFLFWGHIYSISMCIGHFCVGGSLFCPSEFRGPPVPQKPRSAFFFILARDIDVRSPYCPRGTYDQYSNVPFLGLAKPSSSLAKPSSSGAKRSKKIHYGIWYRLKRACRAIKKNPVGA